VFSGHGAAGAKSLSINALKKKPDQGVIGNLSNVIQEGEAIEMTQQRIIMENGIFNRFDFTGDLKKEFGGFMGQNKDIFEYIERKQLLKEKAKLKEAASKDTNGQD
jgi:hypothetical protein